MMFSSLTSELRDLVYDSMSGRIEKVKPRKGFCFIKLPSRPKNVFAHLVNFFQVDYRNEEIRFNRHEVKDDWNCKLIDDVSHELVEGDIVAASIDWDAGRGPVADAWCIESCLQHARALHMARPHYSLVHCYTADGPLQADNMTKTFRPGQIPKAELLHRCQGVPTLKGWLINQMRRTKPFRLNGKVMVFQQDKLKTPWKPWSADDFDRWQFKEALSSVCGVATGRDTPLVTTARLCL